MDDTLIRGDVNELQCILDFQKRGYYCSIPFSGSCRYDLIADVNNNLLRIQCKSCTFHENEGTLHLSTSRQTTNTVKTTRYAYSKDEIDYFYTSWKDYGFLIPIEETASSGKYLRVKEPKSGIQETMCIAADYLIDNVLESIITKNPIKKYKDNRIISINEDGSERIWSLQQLSEKYEERQIRYIKENIMRNRSSYGINWKYKEFPTL